MMYFASTNVLPEKKVPEQPCIIGPWTAIEHKRFLVGLDMFPQGPWKDVANFVGTRTPRQTQTHAQKYREKLFRKMRGLRKGKKKTSATFVSEPTKSLPNILEMVKNDMVTVKVEMPDTGDDMVKMERPTIQKNTLPKQEAVDDKTMLDDLDDLPSIDESLDFLISFVENFNEAAAASPRNVEIVSTIEI
jgi:SHAQKYF class myb-like DNA-binding protein